MLKNIPPIISPDLLKILDEMGHGDEIVIADANFPASTNARRLVRLDGHEVPEVLEAVLKFLPLDTYVNTAVSLMAVEPGDDMVPEVWENYKKILNNSEEPFEEFEYMERSDFYDRSRNAYAVISTGELSLYANIILKKGVITN